MMQHCINLMFMPSLSEMKPTVTDTDNTSMNMFVHVHWQNSQLKSSCVTETEKQIAFMPVRCSLSSCSQLLIYVAVF